MENSADLVTTQQVSVHLHIHRNTIYKYCEMGMPHYRRDRRRWYRFNIEEVKNWLAQNNIKKLPFYKRFFQA